MASATAHIFDTIQLRDSRPKIQLRENATANNANNLRKKYKLEEIII